VARTITTLFRPIADLPRRARPCPTFSAATENGFLGQAPLADFCNHFTEHGHTGRATIPRTKLAISALFAAPAGFPRLRAARHRATLLKPPGWRPKTPAAPAGKLRVSLRAVAPEADSNTCRAPPVTDQPCAGPESVPELRAGRPRPGSNLPRERLRSSPSRGA
jgi:hypothetical protein